MPAFRWMSAATGAALTGAAVTNCCLMGRALSMLSYNRWTGPILHSVLREVGGTEF